MTGTEATESAAKPHNYYGFVIAIIATICIIASIPGQTAGVSVFTNYLMDAYGLSRKSLSLSYLVGTISSAMILPWAGRLLDRIGPRVMILVAALCLSAFLLLLSQGESLIQDAGGTLAFTITTTAFLGIRHFGQGQLTLISRTVLGRWFRQYLGTVNGVVGLAVSFAFGIAPMALSYLAEDIGWQTGMSVLGAMVILAGLLGALLFRTSPETMGLEMEQGLPKKAEKDSEDSIKGTPLKEARKTLRFWIFNLGLALQGGIITAVTFHFSGVCEELGIIPKEGFAIFFPMAVIATIVNMAAGIYSDRYSILPLMAVQLLALGTTPLAMPFIQEPWGYVSVCIGFGVSGGIFTCLVSVAWPRLFGREFLGELAGYNLGWIVFGSAVYPYVVSVFGEWFNSLSTAITLLSGLPIVLLLVSLFRWKHLAETCENRS